ncbi:hypothetical protein POL68_05635 [Stigmatella sp. ncwal1]|uniref:Histidine phosphatase family protein n=1 Tax=Stigmatella ashevillensis TaxID=2995309 RepID=A0ABT5D303_9BACT|nr:hypothetical protein [Stigmatella ashevillena]MDC0707946.1 hypothetical protein [Stigmatella ashevillena]
MSATKIMVIRHAEKPGTYAGQDYAGVNPAGSSDPSSLVTLGWARAGALTTLFAPSRGELQAPSLACPGFLFAANPGSSPTHQEDDQPSRRPYETLSVLSRKLNVSISADHLKTDYKKMVSHALKASGVVLICWQHEDIPAIGQEILRQTLTQGIQLPGKWPGARYDLVWVFDRPLGSGPVTAFTQVPQLLLDGDSPAVIPVDQ